MPLNKDVQNMVDEAMSDPKLTPADKGEIAAAKDTAEDIIQRGENHQKEIANKYKDKFTPTNIGNYRYFKTPARMDKDNKWLGDYYDLHTAYGYGDNKYNYAGKTKNGADIVQLPDGYFSTNPRISGLAAKSVQDLQEYEDWADSQRSAGKGTFLEDFFNHKGIIENPLTPEEIAEFRDIGDRAWNDATRRGVDEWEPSMRALRRAGYDIPVDSAGWDIDEYGVVRYQADPDDDDIRHWKAVKRMQPESPFKQFADRNYKNDKERQWDMIDRGDEFIEEYGNPSIEELGQPIKLDNKTFTAMLNNPSFSREFLKGKGPAVFYSPYRDVVLWVDPEGTDFVKNGILFRKNKIFGFNDVAEPGDIGPDGSSYANSIDDFQADEINPNVTTKQIWDRMQQGESFWDIIDTSLDSEPRNELVELICNENHIDWDTFWDLEEANADRNASASEQLGKAYEDELEKQRIANMKNVSKFAAMYPDRFNALVALYEKRGDELPEPAELDELAKAMGLYLGE